MSPDSKTSAAGQSASADWKSTASSAVNETVSRAKEVASRQGAAAYETAKETARSLGDQAMGRAESYAEEGKSVVTEHLDTFAQAIRAASNELSEKDQTMAAQIVRQAAGGLESLSRSIGGADLHDMINSVRRFGRSNPAAFIGGAVLAGLAIGRFMRASSRHDEWRGGGDWRDDDWNDYDDWDEQDDFQSSFAQSQTPGSSYSPGERAATTPTAFGAGESPAPSQGYAGGGMGRDPSQSSSSGASGGPSSDRDVSLSGSSHSGGAAQPGSISTGARS